MVFTVNKNETIFCYTKLGVTGSYRIVFILWTRALHTSRHPISTIGESLLNELGDLSLILTITIVDFIVPDSPRVFGWR